ncbi:YncE family protein [Streptomyces sp. A1547]|uniref:beta-propeller fold lactonase family protein n=1 Tax=Streptomyces sp. A1547 TaxID=2563105 RepID=UPI001F1042B0|nr:YncE family protein [Streptomyces sp. A1547]
MLRSWFAGLAVLAGMIVPLASATPAAAQARTLAYVTNAFSGTVSVIDTATNTVTATIPVGSRPEGVAVTPDGTRVYVANSDGTTVSVISTASNAVTATITVGRGPRGVAITPDGTRAYVTNSISGTVSVISTATNTVTATVSVGMAPRGVAVGSSVYVANPGSNTVSVIDIASNTVTATIDVGTFPQGVAVNPDSAYVTNTNDGTVSVIDAAGNGIAATIPVGSSPLGVAAALVGGANVYVTNATSPGTVSVINSASNTVTATIPVGSLPQGVAVIPDASRVYVTNVGSDTVSVIDSAANAVTATVNVGDGPVAVAIGTIPVLEQPRIATTLTLKAEEKKKEKGQDGRGVMAGGGLALKARLTTGGEPVDGKPIEFTTDSVSLCTDTTDSRGHAFCKVPRRYDDEACYTATFAGDATHGPSTATACTRNHHGRPAPAVG